MKSTLKALRTTISKALALGTLSEQTPQITMSNDKLFDLATQTLTRDSDIVILAHAQHRELKWCDAAVRVNVRLNDSAEIMSGFALDRIGYALEQDFELQSKALKALLEWLNSAHPDIDAHAALTSDLETAIARVRARWTEDTKNGYRTDRLSTYNDFHSELVLAVPSTAIGSSKIIGALKSSRNDDFERFRYYSAHLKHLRPVSQETLAVDTTLSGHEKLQILSGDKTPALQKALDVFNQQRTLPASNRASGQTQTIAIPETDSTAWRAGLSRENGLDLHLSYANGDRASLVIREYPHEGQATGYFRVQSTIKNLALHLGSSDNTNNDKFCVTGGQSTVTRIPSLEDMNLNFRTLFERILVLDPA